MNISMNGSNCDRSANFMQTTPKKSKNHDSFTQLVSPNINSGGTLLLIFDNEVIKYGISKKSDCAFIRQYMDYPRTADAVILTAPQF